MKYRLSGSVTWLATSFCIKIMNWCFCWSIRCSGTCRVPITSKCATQCFEIILYLLSDYIIIYLVGPRASKELWLWLYTIIQHVITVGFDHARTQGIVDYMRENWSWWFVEVCSALASVCRLVLLPRLIEQDHDIYDVLHAKRLHHTALRAALKEMDLSGEPGDDSCDITFGLQTFVSSAGGATLSWESLHDRSMLDARGQATGRKAVRKKAIVAVHKFFKIVPEAVLDQKETDLMTSIGIQIK